MNLTTELMIKKQLNLNPIFIKEKIENIKLVAGVDISFYEKNNIQMGVCCIVVWDIDKQIPVETVFYEDKMDICYIPGFLCFREYPLFVKALQQLLIKPDIFMFDGNGTLHERKAGLATYAGIKSKISSIGVSKSQYKADNIIYENNQSDKNKKGDFSKVYRINKKDKELVGFALYTKDNSKPVYVSSGNFIEQYLAKAIVLKCCLNDHIIPEPTRLADRYSRDYINNNFNEKFDLKEICVNYCLNDNIKNYNNFIFYLKNHNFFKNIQNEEITNIIKKDTPYKLSLYNKKNKDIIISINYIKEKDEDIVKIGIDPKYCFNSLGNCSILAQFPMNNRTYSTFIKHLDKILDEKTNVHKDWFKNANGLWNGKWAKF